MSKLNEAAIVAMRDLVGLREGEEVLIITNPDGDTYTIARAIFEATRALGGKPVMAIQETKAEVSSHTERMVLEAIRSGPDILVSLSASQLGKDPYGLNIGYVARDGKIYDHIYDKAQDGDKRARGFWSPMATVDMFERCVAVDYVAMHEAAVIVKKMLDTGRKIRITSPAGTDLTFSIYGRKAFIDDGDCSMPGIGGNLPAGEVFISPAVGSARGTIVFDGTIDLASYSRIPRQPVTVIFKDGYISDINGGKDADELSRVIKEGEQMARKNGLEEKARNARHLGELGIGINYSAKMTGNILEDEKAGKTAHFAIGSNYDHDADALIHLDCLVLKPSVFVDGRQVMKDGVLLL